MVVAVSPVNTASIPVNGPSVTSMVSVAVPIVVAPMVAVAVLQLVLAAMTTVAAFSVLVVVVVSGLRTGCAQSGGQCQGK